MLTFVGPALGFDVVMDELCDGADQGNSVSMATRLSKGVFVCSPRMSMFQTRNCVRVLVSKR